MNKGGIVVLIYVLSLIINQSYAAFIASQTSIPSPGDEDVAQLDSPTSDTLNISGTGITSSGQNDSATYVANDRSTQGQTFTTGSNSSGYTLEGIWVRHVGYTNYLDNGTWAGMSDGSEITVRISSVSGTALNVLRSETATVEGGSGFSGGGSWNGTGRWLYVGLDTPVPLSANTLYAFDLTSHSPWFELAGLEAGPYAEGAAYTTAAKLNTNMDTVFANGDRTFIADMNPSEYDGGDAAAYEISLEAITDGIIHVRCVPTGQTAKQSLIVPADIVHDPVAVTIEDNPTTYTLSTPRIRASLNKSTRKVFFYTVGGQLILAESGRSITPYLHQESTGGNTWTLNQIAQTWAASETEAYYGLGQFNNQTMNWQGRNVTLEQGNTTAVSPFVVSSGGYGLLWDVNCSAQFSASNSAGGISFGADASFGLDYYFIYGPDFDGVIHGYRQLTGTAPMYPRWGFGYWQCKERYATQAEVQNIASTFRNYHFPIDLIIQDWRYWGSDNESAPDSYLNMWSGMVWDAAKYPDPDGMISYLHNTLNMKFMAVIWPFIGPNSQLAADLDAHGGLLQGGNNITGGIARLYDAYDEDILDIYWDHANRGLFQRGLDAWWMDASEPEDLYRLSGDTGYGPLHSCHNAFALVHTEGLYKRQRQVSNDKRVVSITRSVYAGQQRTGGSTWSGDIVTSWDTLKNQIASGLNFSMAGLPYWTTDIGGFFTGSFGGNQSPAYQEIYQRWYQYGAFCPLFRSHGTNTAREPWQFDGYNGPIFNNLKKYADLRYRLLPYIYTLGSEVTRNNGTIMRGLPMDFPNDSNCRENGWEFMFGPAFLVRPVTDPITTTLQQTTVYLPSAPAGWYDFWTGQRHDGGVTITKATTIDIMPLYIRAGSIVPMGPMMEWATQTAPDPIELRIYTGADASFTLYEDENDNYNYENGAFSLIPFTWNESEKKLTIGAREGSFPGMLAGRTLNIVFVRAGHGVDVPQTQYGDLRVSYNGQAIVVHQPQGIVNMPEFADLSTGWQKWYSMPDLINLAERWLSYDPPAFTADPIVLAQAALDVPYSGSISGYVDYAGDSLTFSKVDGPAWLTVAANGDLSGTPSASNAGLNLFTVQVSEGAHADQTSLQIPVSYPLELLGHWTLDETSGTTANDSGSKGMDGILQNELSFDTNSVDGQIGKALVFDGTDDYIDVPDGFGEFSNGCTISVWVYPTAVKNWARFIDFGNGSASDNIWFGRRSSSSDLAFECWSGSSSNGLVTAANAITLNEWQLFTVTADRLGNVRLFKNGQLVQTGTSAPASVNRTNNYLGRSNWSADSYYQGRMDDVRIYNYNLSDAAVMALYNGQP